MLPAKLTPKQLLEAITKAQEAGTLDDLMHSEFRVFMWAVWTELGLPTPTRRQLAIAYYLATGPRRRMVQAFRGVGKSWITAAYVLWRLFCNPNERILVVSASKDRADAFSLFCKRLIDEVEWLQYLRPDPFKQQRDSLVAFDVGPSNPHQAPSVRSVGITGQLTGGRASVIVADDIEVPKNSLTVTMRDKLAESVKEFDAVLMSEQDLQAVGLDTADVVYLGTPQTIMSLYNQLPGRGYQVRIWPARYPNPKQQKMYGAALADDVVQDLIDFEGLIGQPTDPGRFNEQDLTEREASYGRSGFALQFMLDTSLSDANRYPLKLADLLVMDLDRVMAPVKLAWGSGAEQVISDIPVVGLPGDRLCRPMYTDPAFAEYQGIVMAIDPSGRGKDRTGYAVVAMLHGFLFTLAVGSLQGGYEMETLKQLSRIAKKWAVKHIIVEPNFGDGMFNKLLSPVLVDEKYPCTVEDSERSNSQKEMRIIDTLEPVFTGHRMVVNASCLREDFRDEESEHQVFYQMTRVTREKGCLRHDDGLDAWAIAVHYWTGIMDTDNKQAVDRFRQDKLDEELAKFMDNALGSRPKSLNWNNSILG